MIKVLTDLIAEKINGGGALSGPQKSFIEYWINREKSKIEKRLKEINIKSITVNGAPAEVQNLDALKNILAITYLNDEVKKVLNNENGAAEMFFISLEEHCKKKAEGLYLLTSQPWADSAAMLSAPNAGALERLKSKGQKIEIGREMEHNSGKMERYFKRVSRNGRIEIYLPDVFRRESVEIQKVLYYIGDKLARNIADDGRPKEAALVLPLAEMVDNGTYQTIDAARKAIYNTLADLQGIRLYASTRKGSRKEETSREFVPGGGGYGVFVLFPSIVINDCECRISLNSDITNWSPITSFYLKGPDYCHRIKATKGRALFSLITKEIRQKGEDLVKISMPRVIGALMLPPVKGCRNKGRDIVDPIAAAVDELNDLERNCENGFIIELPSTAEGDIDLKGELTIKLKEHSSLLKNCQLIGAARAKKIRARIKKAAE